MGVPTNQWLDGDFNAYRGILSQLDAMVYENDTTAGALIRRLRHRELRADDLPTPQMRAAAAVAATTWMPAAPNS